MGETDNFDFHDIWICETRDNPCLWIWIYQITCKNPTRIQDTLSNSVVFWKLVNLDFPTFWNLGILEIWHVFFEILKLWIFGNMRIPNIYNI